MQTYTVGEWSPSSWRAKPVRQIPDYPDQSAADRIVGEMHSLPPLVTSWEIEALKTQLAEAARGERFLLQGGDCAEIFAECDSQIIANKLKILLQMSLVLAHGTRKRVIRVGRFAGQYAKPRSSDTETRNGVTLPSYRGDLINGSGFTEAERTPDPTLMIRGYERAGLTLNFVRALIDGGFADLHHPEYWDLDFVHHSPRAVDYQRIVQSIGESLRFMETLAGASVGSINRVDFFTSHDALHLPYEQALTREVPRRDGWYNLSTHYPWLGLRTAQVDGAHVEYMRGIRNPISVKVGPDAGVAELIELLDVLDPDDEPGRMTLTSRMGVGHVGESLPPLVDAVQASGRTVLWSSDPMHGNTGVTSNGFKTRSFDDILSELEQTFAIHHDRGSRLGGVHFELTGDDVTECVGGARGLAEEHLGRAYRSHVDPRLNYEQALEMAMLVAERVAEMNGHG